MNKESNPLSTVSERKGRRKEIKSPVNKSQSYSHWGKGGGPRQGSYHPMRALGGGREQFRPPTHHWVLMSHAFLSLFPPPPTTADIISTVEFNHTGELLATGDKGGRVVIFQREPEVRRGLEGGRATQPGL